MSDKSIPIIIALIYTFVIIGYFYYKYKRNKSEVARVQALPQDMKVLEIQKIATKLNKYKTSHLLHFFISFFTFGGWVFIWILISFSNSSQRARLEKLMDSI